MTTRSNRLPIAALALVAGLLLPAAPARAYSTEEARRRDLSLLLRITLDIGGDRMLTAGMSDGSRPTIRAGQMGTASGGLIYHPQAPWALETTFGHKMDSVSASNGSARFTRLPLEVVLSWVNERHRIGAGPTVHFAPAFSCHAHGACDISASYDTAVGGVLQYAYAMSAGFYAMDFGARAVVIRYSGPGLKTMDGSCAGVFFSFWL